MMQTAVSIVAMNSYKAMIQGFKTEPSTTSVVRLVEQIRAGFCPGNGIDLNTFVLLCEDEDGQEQLLKGDEEGWNFWLGWRGSYQKDLASKLIPMWQEMLTATGIYAAHIGDIKREEGDAFTLRLHGVAIVLTTMTVRGLLDYLLDSAPGKELAAWKVWEIVDDSDDSVGMHGEAYKETDIPTTIYAGQAMVEATALVVKQLLDAYSRNRAEAEYEAELREQELGIEQELAEAQGATL